MAELVEEEVLGVASVADGRGKRREWAWQASDVVLVLEAGPCPAHMTIINPCSDNYECSTLAPHPPLR